jgi:hypothetical protein
MRPLSLDWITQLNDIIQRHNVQIGANYISTLIASARECQRIGVILTSLFIILCYLQI